jgi:two-component system NtrC family sensor kinase
MSEGIGADEPLSPARLGQLNRLATSARMIAGLAHELNNCLQVVGGLVELLADHPELPPDAAARITKIGTQTDKATAAIRQVLGYTRELAAEQAKVELAGVVGRALALRRYNLGRAGIAVTVDVPAGAQVRADERRVLQIVLNLLLNAEDALAGQSRRDLRFAAAVRGDRLEMQVVDSGPGVEARIRDRIFEPYFTTRADPRAVGLGLPVARGLASELGGAVTLASGEPGKTTFVLDLPMPDPTKSG